MATKTIVPSRKMKRCLFYFTVMGCVLTASAAFATSQIYGLYSQLIWSENGGQLGFTVDLYHGPTNMTYRDVFVYDVYQNNRTCVTPDVEQMVLSPTGQEVVFVGRYGLYQMQLGKKSDPRLLLFKDPTSGDKLVDMAYSQNGETFYYIAYRPAQDRYEVWEYQLLQRTKTLIMATDNLSDERLNIFWQESIARSNDLTYLSDQMAPDRQKRLVLRPTIHDRTDIWIEHIEPNLTGRYFKNADLIWFRWLNRSDLALIAIMEDQNGDGYVEDPSTWILYVNRLEKFKLSDRILRDAYLTPAEEIVYVLDEKLHFFDLNTGIGTTVKTDMVPDWYNADHRIKVETFDPEERDKPARSGFYIHNGNIWRFDRQESFLTQLTQMGAIVEAVISPDREKVAFIRKRWLGGQIPYSEIWMMNINGTSQKKVVDKLTNFGY